LPTSNREKQAFTYYQTACQLKQKVNMQKHYKTIIKHLRLEIDPMTVVIFLYNIGLIHTSNGKHGRALEYYYKL
jgi:hypothetical protein